MGSREGAAGDTSTRIRDAALALFAERGVAALMMYSCTFLNNRLGGYG